MEHLSFRGRFWLGYAALLVASCALFVIGMTS